MTIFGYEITGASRRFFIIVGIFAALVLGAIYLAMNRPPPPDPLTTPFYDPAKLEALANNDKWFQREVDQFGIERLQSMAPLTDGYAANLGQPVRLIAYIPPADVGRDARPSMYTTRDTWDFVPAVLLDPTRDYSLDQLAGDGVEELQVQPMMLGFRQGDTVSASPDTGSVYEVTGLLWWNSNALSPPRGDEAQGGYRSSPVLLVPPGHQPRPISATELAAPTTHRAVLDIEMEAGDSALTMHHLEWSAGRLGGLRACITYQNVGSRPQTAWTGIGNTTAQIEGGSLVVSGAAPDSAALSSTQSLPPQSSITGFITFPEFSPTAGPSEQLILTMPSPKPGSSLTTDGGDAVQIIVEPDQWDDVTGAEASEASASGCSTSASGGSATVTAPSGAGTEGDSSYLLPSDEDL